MVLGILLCLLVGFGVGAISDRLGWSLFPTLLLAAALGFLVWKSLGLV